MQSSPLPATTPRHRQCELRIRLCDRTQVRSQRYGRLRRLTKDPLDDPKVENLSEILKRTRGMSIGIITQAESTDATPAAMVGHTRRRANQDFLAKSYLDDNHRPDVIMGGGSARYLRPPYRDPREKTMTTSSRTSRTRATPSFPLPRK